LSEPTPEEQRRDEQARERERSSRNRTSVDLLRLAGSASSAASSLLDLPGSISSAVSGLSSDAGKVVNFFEGQVNLLRGFGEFGVTFNNDVGRFTADVARSRVSYQQLAGIIQNQTQSLMMFGPTAQQGLNAYLRAQADFRDGMKMQVDDLKQLGYTTQEINETFLEFDRIQNMARIRNYANDRQRNLAAVEFAENLDRLTHLTGKRREQLLQEMQQVSREGDVQARTVQLGEGSAAADSLRNTVTVMGGFGEGIQNLTRDILTRGYALDARMAGIAGPLTDSLYDLRRAQESGNQELIAQKEAEVRHAAAALRQDRRIIELAIHKGRNEYGDLAASILEDTAEGMARAIEHGREVVGRNLGKSAAEVTSEELRAYFERTYDASTAARLNRNVTGPNAASSGQQLFSGVQGTLTRLEDAQAQIVEGAVSRIFNVAGGPAQRFGEYLDGIVNNNTIGGSIDRIVGLFDTALNEISPGGVSAGIQEAANNAYAAGNTALAQQIQTLRTIRDQSTDPGEVARLNQQIDDLIRQAPNTLEVIGDAFITANGGTIEARADNVDLSPLVEAFRQREAAAAGAGTANAIGTLGTIGRYFKDYGLGTGVTLHGMEAVMTPAQASEWGAMIAGGAAGEIAATIGNTVTRSNKTALGTFDTSFNSSMQSVSGMLNTVRSTVRDSSASNEPFDLSELESRLASVLNSGFDKNSMSDSLRELTEPLRELITVNREQLRNGERQLRSFRGMSGDALRGA
jgi:hypothetical protein